MARTKQKRKIAAPRVTRGILRKKPSVPASRSKKLLGKDLEGAVEQFQSEPDQKKAHEQWKRIETAVFGVQFED